jgi:hypothetical protein
LKNGRRGERRLVTPGENFLGASSEDISKLTSGLMRGKEIIFLRIQGLKGQDPEPRTPNKKRRRKIEVKGSLLLLRLTQNSSSKERVSVIVGHLRKDLFLLEASLLIFTKIKQQKLENRID